MLLNILQLIFCAIPFAVSLTLYKSNKRCMAAFYMAMARSDKARKFYVQIWLICLLCICVRSYRRIWHPAIYRSLCRHVLVQADG